MTENIGVQERLGAEIGGLIDQISGMFEENERDLHVRSAETGE